MYHLLNPKNIINEPKNYSNYKSNKSCLTKGATRGLEVERRTRNWAIRVQFPPGAK